MKKKALILALSILIYYFSNSQTIVIGMEGGYSAGHTAVAGFNIGMNFKDFNIRTGLDQHFSSAVSDGTIFKTSIGHTFNIGEIFYATAAVGHAYILKSMDRKDLNRPEFLINPEVGYKWEFKGQAMATYLGYSHAGEYNIFTIGLRGLW